VPDATYLLRLHFCETFESNFHAGLRAFDVRINGLRLLHDFDPYAAAGGFARPTVQEFRGIGAPNGRLLIEFGEHACLNAVELFRQSAVPVPRRRRVRMLFIGNSHCFFWAVPESLAAMVNTAPTGLHLEVDRCLKGGKDAMWLYDNTDAVPRIRDGKYDYVVMQSKRMEQADDPKRMMTCARKYAARAARAGSTMLMYCTWPPKDAPLTAYQEMADVNRAIARATGMQFVPAGPAWANALRSIARLRLHNSNTDDRVHAGMYGAYLAVCTFYSVLTGASAEAHPRPALVAGQAPIKADLARRLARIAWRTVQEY
jgi:hypothetical protein